MFANIICECFKSQDFLRFQYWDDGYVIGQLINENDLIYYIIMEIYSLNLLLLMKEH